ncbi:hypothetical protein L6164_001154 [Bauhinia variegata]|uniref:Uncharacterized protein n=1 Tax=Bauhinia variegata TaxID=167791 RepID=A0ACB9Q8N0_BAUVA|nr:hypothetical protein L6164_001154 [Bauhinia variegata]
MRSAENHILLPLDPEVEKTCRRNRNEQRVAKNLQPEPETMAANNHHDEEHMARKFSNNQFVGGPNEDPNLNLSTFLEICDTFKYNGVSNEAIKLWLFSFSLRDGARWWLNSLPPGSIEN